MDLDQHAYTDLPQAVLVDIDRGLYRTAVWNCVQARCGRHLPGQALTKVCGIWDAYDAGSLAHSDLCWNRQRSSEYPRDLMWP